MDVTNSGDFGSALTVGGIPVSLSGHSHQYGDITNFCDGVATCVDTPLLGSSGIQFNYNETNLVASLSGEALAQHSFNSTGFIVRTGSLAYSGRAITNGSNIQVTNGDGISGNPVVALSGTITGLTSVTSTDFIGDLAGTSSSAEEVHTSANNTSNEHYLTFVDTHNGSAESETIYTGSGLRYIPSTDTLIVGNISGVIAQANSIKTLTASNDATYYLTFVSGDNSSPGAYESLRTDGGIKYNPSSNLVTLDGDINASGASITNNLVVGGDLTVNGTTVTANVDSMVVEDPIITLGKPSGTIAAENKDRGVEFVYPSGSSTVAATGFFGFDKSATEFIAARDVTIAGEIVTVNNSSYLDARFNDIDGSTITASTQFSGPGTGLTGTASSLTVGKATNLDGGDAGRIPYQTAPGTTTFLNIGTSGQFLRVNDGAGAPYWDTVNYAEIGNLPTIGTGVLTIATNSDAGLSVSATPTFSANENSPKTITISSNATSANDVSTIVFRDSGGNFSAGTITADLTGTATNATNASNINVQTNSQYLSHIVFVNGTNGNREALVNTNLKFNAGSNILYGTDYSSSTTPTTKIEYFIIDGGTP